MKFGRNPIKMTWLKCSLQLTDRQTYNPKTIELHRRTLAGPKIYLNPDVTVIKAVWDSAF